MVSNKVYPYTLLVEKYLCVDTNIFIQCCLLELQTGDDIGAVSKLLELLENNSLKLLLPEVISIEFKRKIQEKTQRLTRQIDTYKRQVGKDGELDDKVKVDIDKKLDEVIDSRVTNRREVEKKIDSLFSHHNTQQLLITPEVLVEAYRSSLSGKKPHNPDFEKNQFVQPDTLIVQILKKTLYGRKDYELYLCSNNKHDFAAEEKGEVARDNPRIHADIAREFHHIEYRTNLLKLLNDKFETDFPEDSIEQLESKQIFPPDSVEFIPESPTADASETDLVGGNPSTESETAL